LRGGHLAIEHEIGDKKFLIMHATSKLPVNLEIFQKALPPLNGLITKRASLSATILSNEMKEVKFADSSIKVPKIQLDTLILSKKEDFKNFNFEIDSQTTDHILNKNQKFTEIFLDYKITENLDSDLLYSFSSNQLFTILTENSEKSIKIELNKFIKENFKSKDENVIV
jgi:hypothetical protein